MNSRKGDPLATVSVLTPFVENGESLSQQRLSELFNEHHRRILIAAYRITGSMADAEDVTQSVFLRLTASTCATQSNPRSYLYRAAINGALDLLRRRKAAMTEPLDDLEGELRAKRANSPDDVILQRQLGQSLRVAIGELAPRAAEMFTLRYIEEFNNREIANVMGTSQAVVAVTLHNARSRLKKRLRELEEEKR